MCGGVIPVNEGARSVQCDYCGSQQSVFFSSSSKEDNLLRRADNLRFACEFDMAIGVYLSILSDFPKCERAYWGLALSRYGVEYVEDPSSGMKKPTCHRTISTSFLVDRDYLKALEYGDVISKASYEEEGKKIDAIQKRIATLSMGEEPYDIFLCYKENDGAGGVTEDASIAYNIYKALEKEGYRVFYSRVSLDKNIGEMYEPYIYSALRTSRVMIHVTTSEEHTSSVWVKNEWSRYLEFLREEKGKTFIPCFKGVSMNELPIEIRSYQGIDFGKVGAMETLLVGLGKIFLSKKMVIEEKREKKEKEDSFRKNDYEELLRKGKKALLAYSYKEASDFFKRAIDETEYPGEAYFNLLLCEFACQNIDEVLNNFPDRARVSGNYRLARAFCGEDDEKLKKSLAYMDDFFLKKDKEDEEKRKEEIYKSNVAGLKEANSSQDTLPFIKWFSSHLDYKDSEKYLARAKKRFIHYASSPKDIDLARLYVGDVYEGEERTEKINKLNSMERSYRIDKLRRAGLIYVFPKNDLLKNISIHLKECKEAYAESNRVRKKLDEKDIEIIDSWISYSKRVIVKTLSEEAIASFRSRKETDEVIASLKAIAGLNGNPSLFADQIAALEANKKKVRKRRIIIAIILIAFFVILWVLGVVVQANNSSSSQYISITAEDVSYTSTTAYFDVEVRYEIRNSASVALTEIEFSSRIEVNGVYAHTFENDFSNLDLSPHTIGTYYAHLRATSLSANSGLRKLYGADFSSLSFENTIKSLTYADGRTYSA